MDRMRCGQIRSSTKIALSKFWARVPWLLKAAIMLEVVLHKLSEAGVIGGLLIFNAVLAYLQESAGGPVILKR
jgi:H+-transporting ATPase